MSKKGSALMQVMVIGLIVAAFSVLILRYSVTRSSNMSRTERLLEMEIVADSCLEQYMAYLAYAELRGTPPDTRNFKCRFYKHMTEQNLTDIAVDTTNVDNDITRDYLIMNFVLNRADVEQQ